MLKQIVYFLVMAAAMMTLSMSGILPGFSVDGFQAALVGAVVLALANALLKPVLFLLTLPFTIMTLGLFLLVLNALMLGITARVVPGLHLQGAFTTLVASVLLSLVGMIWNAVSKDDGRRRKRDRDRD
ncbi:MAG: phage holin family protein [Candidatus Eisenbacteria bacterium]|nr:phage holin family protein [Candidatus Eisenbacteria bacterium]